jgi:hypothetical protein
MEARAAHSPGISEDVHISREETGTIPGPQYLVFARSDIPVSVTDQFL